MCVDALAADGHKWLMANPGAGFLYIRRKVQERLRPLSIGWLNVRSVSPFRDDEPTLTDGPARYEAGSLNLVGLVGLLLEAGIDAVSRRVRGLTDRLVDGFVAKGYTVASPRGEDERSGIVSFGSSSRPAKEVVAELRRRSIWVALRDGRVRVSPHFYNTDRQIDQVIDALPDG